MPLHGVVRDAGAAVGQGHRIVAGDELADPQVFLGGQRIGDLGILFAGDQVQPAGVVHVPGQGGEGIDGFDVLEQVRDGAGALLLVDALAEGALDEVAGVRVRVDGAGRVAAELGQGQSDAHRRGGLADAALEAQDGGVVAALELAGDAPCQFVFFALPGARAQVQSAAGQGVERSAEAADGPGLLLADKETRGADEIGSRGGQRRRPAGGAGGPGRQGGHGGGAFGRRRHGRTARQGRGRFEGGRLRLEVLERLFVERLVVKVSCREGALGGRRRRGRRAAPVLRGPAGSGGRPPWRRCVRRLLRRLPPRSCGAADALSVAVGLSTASEVVMGMVPVRASESSPRRRSRRRRSSGCSASAAALTVLLSTGSGILVPPGTHSADGCGARLIWSKLQF